MTERFLNDPESGDALSIAYHWWEFNAANKSIDAQKIELFREYIHYLEARGVLFARLDRSQWEGDHVSMALSSPVGLSVLPVRQGSPHVFVLVGSVAIVVFSTYAIALRRRLRSGGRRD